MSCETSLPHDESTDRATAADRCRTCDGDGEIELYMRPSGVSATVPCGTCAGSGIEADLRITIEPESVTHCRTCSRLVGRHVLTGNWNHVRRVGRAFEFVTVTPKHLAAPR